MFEASLGYIKRPCLKTKGIKVSSNNYISGHMPSGTACAWHVQDPGFNLQHLGIGGTDTVPQNLTAMPIKLVEQG
jgi:hypothetical protein